MFGFNPQYVQIFSKSVSLALILNLAVTGVGLFGIFFNKKNLLLILISMELVFLGINLNFVIVSVYLDDIIGQILVLFILTVVAGESAIALSLFIIIYQFRKTLSIIDLQDCSINKL